MIDAPIRAFLMVHSDTIGWTVTVCRNLGAIVHAWKSRKKPDEDVAVLHVGFDRPPSRTFEKIARANPGRLLLTAAARHALPSSFVASVAPVGSAGNFEVFLGLQGWGYSLADPTIDASRSGVTCDKVTPEPRGWVASFLREHPGTAEVLEGQGIYDDTSFLGRESELERNIRHRMGVFRVHHLVGARCEDPCEIARVAPPWLAGRALTALNLPVRASNVFKANAITAIKDLSDWPTEALLSLQHFGQKSLKDTAQTMNAALTEGPPGNAKVDEISTLSQPSSGYSLADPTIAAVSSEMAGRILTLEPRGWVASFLKEHSAAAEVLTVQGIYDETSYLERESELERNIRHRMGVFRVHRLVGAKCEDPCAIARLAPPWLAKRELTSLNLTVRACNLVKINAIRTVKDLSERRTEALLRLQDSDQESLRDIAQTLRASLSEGPARNATADETSGPSQLLTEIRRSLQSFPDRERDILVRRLGFETTPETLQEVADDYGLTREGIRQIEVRAKDKWTCKFSWDDILEQKITLLLVGRRFPLPAAGVEALDPWFEGVSSYFEFFKNLVRLVGNDRIHLLNIDGAYYLSLMGQAVWERTVSESRALLSSGVGQEWNEQYARSLVHGLLPDSAREFGSLLWDRSSRLCYFRLNSDGSSILKSCGRGAEQLVDAILADSDSPLHYTEIAERAHLRHGRRLDPRRAQAAAAKVGYLFARGTYGLPQHVPLSNEQMGRIRAEAEDIVCSETLGRQWHTFEILSELAERLDGDTERLDKYILNIALTKSEILRPLGKMTWAATAQDTDDQARIGIHQAVIALVKTAGRPLSTSEIKERLTAVRGVNEFFQIHPIDPLIRVQPGVWGINDRDVPLSREEQRELVEDLVRELDAKQSGIHASELSSVLPLRGCSPDAFLSIAIQDGRLKLAQGRYVYLTGWGSSRRRTIRKAVSAVLEEATRPLLLEEIATLVEHWVGRKCDKPVISSALQALEADFNESTGEWCLSMSEFADG